jgi:hypothetical protein
LKDLNKFPTTQFYYSFLFALFMPNNCPHSLIIFVLGGVVYFPFVYGHTLGWFICWVSFWSCSFLCLMNFLCYFSYVFLPFVGQWHSRPWPCSFIPIVFGYFDSQLTSHPWPCFLHPPCVWLFWFQLTSMSVTI